MSEHGAARFLLKAGCKVPTHLLPVSCSIAQMAASKVTASSGAKFGLVVVY